MKRTDESRGFFGTFLYNLLLNAGWSIPAWVLLALHYISDVSIWWFVTALVLWPFGVLLGTLISSRLARVEDPSDVEKENKNPYSAKNSEPRK